MQVTVSQGQVGSVLAPVLGLEAVQLGHERLVLPQVLCSLRLLEGLREDVLQLDPAELAVLEGLRQALRLACWHLCAVGLGVHGAHDLAHARSHGLVGDALEEALHQELVGAQELHDEGHALSVEGVDLGQVPGGHLLAQRGRPLLVRRDLELHALAVELRLRPQELDEVRGLLHEDARAALGLHAEGVVEVAACDLPGRQLRSLRERALRAERLQLLGGVGGHGLHGQQGHGCGAPGAAEVLERHWRA
mmetsp:Transcript_52871/g.169342  ORF Transcript_52871/g.169342 Transcript_52871/m.169342 type:complete len:249 (+) Transcript_52871:609-1355(+)